MALHHLPWTVHMVIKRQAWHAIIAFGQHTQSNEVRHGKVALPLNIIYGQTTSSVASHHSPWTTQKVQ